MESTEAGRWYVVGAVGSFRVEIDELFHVQPRIFSRPRRHAPFTNDTLHMFTRRKPNHRHDIYNPPYEGSPKPKTPTSGPDRREQRKARMAAMRKRKDLAPLLAGTRL